MFRLRNEGCLRPPPKKGRNFSEGSPDLRAIRLPHSVGGIAGAVLVTDKAIKARGTESLLAIGSFKTSFTQTGSIDVVALGSIVALALLVTLWAVGAHGTVILTPVHSGDTALLRPTLQMPFL